MYTSLVKWASYHMLRTQATTPLCAISGRLRLLSAQPTPIRHVNKQAINFHGFSCVFITVGVECALEPTEGFLILYVLFHSLTNALFSFLLAFSIKERNCSSSLYNPNNLLEVATNSKAFHN